MTHKSLGSLRPFVLAAILLSALTASTLSVSQPAIYATSTFQREVDTPSPGPLGTAVLEEKGSSQIFSVTIKNLSGPSIGSGGSGWSSASFGLFIGLPNTNIVGCVTNVNCLTTNIVGGVTNLSDCVTNVNCTTNIPDLLIAPLNLRGTNDTWSLKYTGVGAAPAQLYVANLEELSGLYLFIGNPVIEGGVTNLSDCVTNVNCTTTNIVGGVMTTICTTTGNCVTISSDSTTDTICTPIPSNCTNITVGGVPILSDCVTNVNCLHTNIVGGVVTSFMTPVLFTQIPAFTTKSKAPHLNRKSKLTTPSVPPNPAEKGWVKTMFNGAQGRSVFDLSAFHLSGGGAYSIFIENPPSSSIMTNIGPLVISTNSAHTGSFSRDTRKGETLPFQVPTVRDLSGRAIQIQDGFGGIHLEGTIP